MARPMAMSRISSALCKLRTKSFRDYLAVFRATFVNQILGVLRGFVVAKFLGPADYGLMSSVRLISMLDKFGSLGLVPVVTREVTYLQGQEQDRSQRIDHIKATGYSAEVLLSFLLTLVGLSSTLFVDDLKIAGAIAIASSVLFFAKIHYTLGAEIIITKQFALYARVSLWLGIGTSLTIMAGVPWGGIWWVLAVPMFQSIAAIAWYKRHVRLTVKWEIDKAELVRQLKVGIPIILHILSFASYRYAERLLILWYFTIEDLGYVSLGLTAMGSLMTLTLIGPKLRKVRLGELLGAGNFHQAHQLVVRETLGHVLLSMLAAAVLWPLLEWAVPILLPQYVQGITYIQILVLAVITRNLQPYPQVVLVSPLIDKQSLLGPAQLICTGLFIGTAILLNAMGQLTLEMLLLTNVFYYTVYSLWFPIWYYIYFVRVYLRKPSATA